MLSVAANVGLRRSRRLQTAEHLKDPLPLFKGFGYLDFIGVRLGLVQMFINGSRRDVSDNSRSRPARYRKGPFRSESV
jgi:hypothetical protein